MDHADEEDVHIRAGRRRDPLAVLRARQAAPGEGRQSVVLDRRVADTDGRALGEAEVVADVPLLRTVVDAYRTCLDIVRPGERGPDCALADGNGNGDAP